MITRSDLNESAFDLLIRTELIEQLECLKQDEPTVANIVLQNAFNHVIAYNSKPGEYEEGKYDL